MPEYKARHFTDVINSILSMGPGNRLHHWWRIAIPFRRMNFIEYLISGMLTINFGVRFYEKQEKDQEKSPATSGAYQFICSGH